jgi:hypothetical protein
MGGTPIAVKRETRTSSIQRGQLCFRENRNFVVIEFVPIVVFVIDRPLVNSSGFTGPRMENTLFGKSDVVAGIRRGTLVRDYRCSFVVRDWDDAGGETGSHVPTNSYSPVGLAPISPLTSGLISASSSSNSFFL